MIYVDNAATTFMHAEVLDAMTPYLLDQAAGGIGGNPSSAHAAGRAAAHALSQARRSVAACLGCDAREVLFCSGGTEAINQAVATAAREGAAQGRKHLVASAIEHPAVLRSLDFWESCGFETTLVVPDVQGVVAPDVVAAALRADTCLAAVMFVNNETGVVQPVADIARACHAQDVPVLCDAVQAAGHIPIDLDALGADFLALSAHKFHGPKGTGALVCRRPRQAASIIVGGGQERGCRAGTENVAGIVGLAAALSAACDGMEVATERMLEVRERIERGLAVVGGVRLNGADAMRAPHIVNVCFADIDRQALLALLDAEGVCASVGSACSAGAVQKSHVLAATGVPDEWARGALRISISRDTTLADADAVVAAVARSVAQLREVRA